MENLLSLKPIYKKRLTLEQPILKNIEMEAIKNIETFKKSEHKAIVLDATFSSMLGQKGMIKTLENLKSSSEQAIKNGANIIVISDRNISEEKIKSIDVYNLEDEKDIAIVKEKTKNNLIERGLIEKIFGGVGKSQEFPITP